MSRVVVEKNWSFKTLPSEQDALELRSVLNGIAEERKDDKLIDFPVDLCKLLIQRGVDSKEAIEDFFFADLENLHDPMLMKGMDAAVKRIIKAVDAKEGIMILGDYDVDGTTSAAMMFMFINSLTENCRYYIPDRYKEGYGISMKSIDVAAEGSNTLMISLDCGIKAVKQIEYANEKGVDFIICDHHTPGQILPPALAVLDPKQRDCNYPFKELSGCGVGFKLIQALANTLNLDKKVPYQYLDLLATSIAADIVPMVGENRILAKYGLMKINRKPLAGIAALKKVSGMKKAFEITDIVFKIAPRINSAGRMSHGSEAVNILISNDIDKAIELANEVEEHNKIRRSTDHDITLQAEIQIQDDNAFKERSTTVLFDPSWHKGVIGIVASRMIEQHYRPTIIFTGSEGILSGSARSVRGFDIYEAIERCEDLLIQYGGHKFAAGMTMKEENFDAFSLKFDQVVSELIQEEHLHPVLDIDAHLKLKDIDLKFFKQLNLFAPFGPGNMSPVFYSDNLLARYPRELKDKFDKSHLKMQVFDPDNQTKIIDSIGFGLGKNAGELDDGIPFELVYAVEENTWRDKTEVQLNIKDIHI